MYQLNNQMLLKLKRRKTVFLHLLKIPSVTTSDAWKLYYSKKQEEKEKSEAEKELRKRKREERELKDKNQQNKTKKKNVKKTKNGDESKSANTSVGVAFTKHENGSASGNLPSKRTSKTHFE